MAGPGLGLGPQHGRDCARAHTHARSHTHLHTCSSMLPETHIADTLRTDTQHIASQRPTQTQMDWDTQTYIPPETLRQHLITAHKHTCTRARRVHQHSHTYVHTYTYSQILGTDIHIDAHTDTCTQMYVYRHTYAHICVHTDTYIQCADTHGFKNTFIHIYADTHPHMHTYIHTHGWSWVHIFTDA